MCGQCLLAHPGLVACTPTITQQAADYTLVMADAGTEVESTKATAQATTIPLNATTAVLPSADGLSLRSYEGPPLTVQLDERLEA